MKNLFDISLRKWKDILYVFAELNHIQLKRFFNESDDFSKNGDWKKLILKQGKCLQNV